MSKYITKEGDLLAVSFDGDTWWPADFSEYTGEEYGYDVYITTLEGKKERFLFPMCESIHDHFKVPDKKEGYKDA